MKWRSPSWTFDSVRWMTRPARTQRFQLRWEPHGHVRRYEDGFGNAAHLLTSTRNHGFVQVSTEAEVETHVGRPVRHSPRGAAAVDATRAGGRI